MEKDLNNIIRLLEKFYEGNSYSDEEQILLQYFRQEDIPQFLEADKETFFRLYALSEAEELSLPDGFDQRLDSFINKLAEKKPKNKVYLYRRQIAGIAACVALILSIVFFVNNKTHDTVLVDTYTTPEEAYSETQKALLLVSSKMNKGLGQLEKAEKDMTKMNKILNEKLN